jgi:hypothetical protein
MMTLDFNLKKDWPKLAWVCVVSPDNDSAVVKHGPMVEINEHWAVEAVWDGEFIAGDFDKTDLVFGSGIRQRDSELTFVSSATGVDRLWYADTHGRVYVSNTLPGLLSVSGLKLRDDYFNYSDDIMTIDRKGIYSYTKEVPSSGPPLRVVYYKNLRWASGSIIEVEKMDKVPEFNTFRSYEKYLRETADKLGENSRSSTRKFKIDMLVGISSGYDSVATAVVSRYAGCHKAVTIKNSSSLWRGSDSGELIAEKLEMSCQVVTHDKNKYRHEVATWAAAGHAGGRGLTLFDYPKPLCLFFNGGYGDVIWDRSHQGLKEPSGDMDALMCEFRLIEGFFVTVVPWWGIRKAKHIQKINLFDEMKPWTVGTNYDRPIARRLAEEAGIERGTFAIRKKDTASNVSFWWPATKDTHDGFNLFLQNMRMTPYSKGKVLLLKNFHEMLKLFNDNVHNTLFFINGKKKWKPWLKSSVRHLFFVWSNHSVRDKYYR